MSKTHQNNFLWFLFGFMIACTLAGCASNPKTLMKNCTKIHDDYYECDPVEKPAHEHHGRFN